MGVAPPSSLVSWLRLTAGLLASAALGLVLHVVTARGPGPAGYRPLAATLTYAALWSICLVGLGRAALAIPIGATAAAAMASALAVVVGWTMLAERPIGRAIVAPAVSLGLWQAMSPWPIRHLGAALGRAR